MAPTLLFAIGVMVEVACVKRSLDLLVSRLLIANHDLYKKVVG